MRVIKRYLMDAGKGIMDSEKTKQRPISTIVQKPGLYT
ncbi:MAG: hypothetical protein OFPI_12220 [Osedax symbiont Rs2]|nr:MAG: hypothetical protein OFPI_12220 [Osedax symbiont Rs2]